MTIVERLKKKFISHNSMPIDITEHTRHPGEVRQDGFGLTKREYFAIHALQGILANPNELDVPAAAAAIHEAEELLMALQE